MKKYFRLLVIFLVFSCWIPHITSAQVVRVPDANLAEALRQAFGLAPNAPITKQQMQSLRIFGAPNRQIKDLTGLEHATRLERLHLEENQIQNLNPLTRLTELWGLTLWTNQISDLRPLSGLKGLVALEIGDNQIRDVSPLAGLTQLLGLNLSSNQIQDISPLRNLTQLEWLLVGNNRISNLSPLARMRQLDRLYLAGNQISNLSSLSGLTQLTWLILGKNKISSIRSLTRLTQLEVLILDRNQISDVSSLEGLTQLRQLWLNENNIRDVSALGSLVNLERLQLAGNPITDTSPLAKLTNLVEVDVKITTQPRPERPTEQTPDPPEEGPALIPDTGLAAAVREKLRLKPNASITKERMQKLTSLTANVRQIKNLTGLEHATQLEKLSLHGNQIRDLSPLADLSQLKELVLGSNQIRDVNPLAGLTQLEWLALKDNQIRDVSPLAGLVNLRALFLVGNPITDTSPLASLTNLVEVDVKITAPVSPGVIPDPILAAAVRKALGLGTNAAITKQDIRKLTFLNASNRQITNYTGLEHATQLEWLVLTGNEIQDVSPFSGLTQLQRLVLDDNQIQDVSPLAGMTQLQWLYLRDNQIRDVSPLANLTKLKRLVLHDNQIQDVSPLAELMELDWLYLRNNQIQDVSPLAGLVNLKKLYLAGNPIKDTSPLASLTKLTDVDVEITAPPTEPVSKDLILDSNLAAAVRESLNLAQNASITEQAMQGLTRLDVSNRQITDLTGIEHATQLEWLNLSGNGISDVSPLAALTQLEWLNLIGNEISDVSSLAGLTQLEQLGLSNNEISDVSPLAGLAQLESLYLINNEISDVSPLSGLVNLERLRLMGNPVTDTTPLVNLTNLDDVDIEISTPITDAADTMVSVSPSMVASPAVGEQIIFSLNISNGENVAGYQATISYDASALRYVSSANGDYLSTSAFFLPPAVDGNTVTLASTSQSGERNGNGTLATATFEVVAVKDSTVTLSHVLLSDSAGTGSRPSIEAAEISVPPRLAEDINADGIVNIQDLVLVATNFGKTGQNAADVNGDAVVDIRDLVRVAGAFGNNAAAAPFLHPEAFKMFTVSDVRNWLSEAKYLDLTDTTSLRGIGFLEQVLRVLTPKETVLLANYPNPFNPETWIPYRLSKSAEVEITIYNVRGRVVRRMDLGHQSAGVYESQSRAVYWDGRNALGEPVASGVYFYTLTAGDFTATRKMLIRK